MIWDKYWFILRAVVSGWVQWVGEAVVGLLPLFAYMLNHGFGADRYVSALCNSRINDNPAMPMSGNCMAIEDSPLAEICVLSMVISGLSLLSSVQFASGRRQTPRNPLTYLMQLAAILSLVAGALFYAKITSHTNSGHDEWGLSHSCCCADQLPCLGGANIGSGCVTRERRGLNRQGHGRSGKVNRFTLTIPYMTTGFYSMSRP
jgi:hypothetical protein